MPAINLESTLVSYYIRRAPLPGLTLRDSAGNYRSYKYLCINPDGFVNRHIPYFDDGVNEIQRALAGWLQQVVNEHTGQFIGDGFKELRVRRSSKPTTHRLM